MLGPHDIFDVLDRSLKARCTAETMLNRESSRSHALFTISVDLRCEAPDGDGQVQRRGKLMLVDLCGSENLKRSGSEGARAREAGHIGQSLLVLGRVIRWVRARARARTRAKGHTHPLPLSKLDTRRSRPHAHKT